MVVYDVLGWCVDVWCVCRYGVGRCGWVECWCGLWFGWVVFGYGGVVVVVYLVFVCGFVVLGWFDQVVCAVVVVREVGYG